MSKCHHSVDRVQTLRGALERRDNKNKYARTNFQQQQACTTQGFILMFNSPLRLVYVLIVEATSKVEVSFTSLPHSNNHKGKLEFFTRKQG
jgi:hypothetical protein